jgi:hypothetical protein
MMLRWVVDAAQQRFEQYQGFWPEEPGLWIFENGRWLKASGGWWAGPVEPPKPPYPQSPD